ncbi:ArsA-related P-loop ATPase [Streptomyces sp. B6B3]|uniref:ArsA family ATPase n=1 Tax=Streptomyces sp. B6B3 TaxID=3153570 RepID=UPI00325CD25C
MTAEPRTLFVTGPGGDGSTTVAAGTALAAARAGAATLLLTTAPPAPLAALLGTAPPVWPETVAVPEDARGAAGGHSDAERPGAERPGRAARLDVARVDAAAAFRAGVLELQRRVRPALDAAGAAALDDDELTDLPGSCALALLRSVPAAHAAGRWDLLVVDLPSATEALRLLALPEQLRRYLRRLLPPERLTARGLRPLLAQLTGVPLPFPDLFAATDRWDAALASAQRVIDAPGTAVRLVVDPGSDRSVTVARAARAGLALHGLALDAVIANRMLPAGSADPWLAGAADRQRTALAGLVRAAGLLAPHPEPRELPHLGRAPGPADLGEVPPPGPWGLGGGTSRAARARGSTPMPAAHPHRVAASLDDRRTADGLLVWRLPLPGAVREELDLVRRGDELIVTTGPFRRLLALPAVLRRCTVTGAALEDDGTLAVRFAPDPAQWPREPAGG